MVDQVTLNARKPSGTHDGEAMLNRMNDRHRPLYKWGLEHISIDTARDILDIGYGGGQNIKNLCTMAPQARIEGVDYSEASYEKAVEVNQAAIAAGQVRLQVGSAEALPYGPDTFDLVTAFETVYYWPEIESCFRSVHAALKDRGMFLVCNEDCSREGNEEIAQALHMNFYDENELKALMEAAGFRTVHTYLHPRGRWVCAVGIK